MKRQRGQLPRSSKTVDMTVFRRLTLTPKLTPQLTPIARRFAWIYVDFHAARANAKTAETVENIGFQGVERYGKNPVRVPRQYLEKLHQSL